MKKIKRIIKIMWKWFKILSILGNRPILGVKIIIRKFKKWQRNRYSQIMENKELEKGDEYEN